MKRILRAMASRLSFCSHSRVTFPMSPAGRKDVAPHVTCLDCGREWEYDWQAMRAGAEVKA